MENIIKPPEIIIKTFTKQLIFPEIFNNNNHVWLEIGFGVGKFFLQIARNYPEVNLIGIEYAKFRYYKMISKIKSRNLKNVMVIETDASVGIKYLLPDNSINAVFINFPDPWPKSKHEKKRLICEEFAECLHKTLKKDGFVRILTDMLPYSVDIKEAMLNNNLFKLSDNNIDDKIDSITTTFQDRFAANNLPCYKHIFLKN